MEGARLWEATFGVMRTNHIFRCMFIPGQPENDRVATTQLTIFDI